MQEFQKTDLKTLETHLGVKKTPSKHEEKLWEKVGEYTPKFAKIPGILCICVGNSLAMNATHKNSDIDLFIITKTKRIWTVRVLMTLMLMFYGQRKTSKRHAGKFCLSFFITEKSMDLDSIAIKNDIYLAYWIKTLKPILDRQNTFEKFLSANNNPTGIKKSLKQETMFYKERKFLTLLGDICEKIIQLFLLPKTKKSFQKLGKPFGVIIGDDILKFHDKDKRKDIRDIVYKK